jgi:hypothetical protein
MLKEGERPRPATGSLSKGATRMGRGLVTRTGDEHDRGREFGGTSRFQVERVLGAGGMGVVYQVYDRERNARVALKTLRAVDGLGLQRFKNEFRALTNLTHGNLVRLGELFCEQDQWFFTMELLFGQSFSTYVRAELKTSEQRFDEARLRTSLAQLAAGLLALHAAELVHRDVKPSNIMVTPSGRLVLLDFGLVAQTQHTESSAAMIGTVLYMAPEQARLLPAGPAADWYSVGVILYEALTGELPFSGSGIALLQAKEQRDPPPPSGKVSGIPRDLDELCMSLLARDPALRLTGAQMAQRLGLAPADLTLPAPPPSGTFVGRQEELSLLHQAFVDVSDLTRGVTVCLQGESGLGKTALVRFFLDEIPGYAPGAVLLEGRCYERELVPFKAFDGVVDALGRTLARMEATLVTALLPRDAEALACLFPGLGRLPGMFEGQRQRIASKKELRTRAFAALRELLCALSVRHPVVIAIDDFQWADADSMALLGDLMGAPEPPPFVLLLISREGTTGPAAAASHLPGDVRRIPLPPLGPSEAEALATLWLPDTGGAGRPALPLVEEAAGHPLFLHELARYVAQVGVFARGTVHLDDALWARIDRLPPQARTILEVLAVAAAPLTESTAARAATVHLEEFAALSAELRTAQLLRSSGPSRTDTVEPYHDRVREAVLKRLPEEARTELHARLAHALEDCGAEDPQVLVRHLLAVGDTTRASAQAERAARKAESVLAFDQAAVLYRMAAELCEKEAHVDPDRRRALRRCLADALVNAGQGAEAALEYQGAAQGATPTLAANLRRLACEQLLLSGRVDEGLALAGEVLADIGLPLPKTPRAALWSLLCSRMRLKLRGLRYRPRAETEVPPMDLVRIDACWSISAGLCVVDFIRGADFATRGLLYALEAGEPCRVARAVSNEASFSASAGYPSRRRTAKLVLCATKLAESVSSPQVQAQASFAAGSCAFMEGRWRDARHHLLLADGTYRGLCTGVTWELDSVHVDLIVSLAYLGELKEQGQRVREYLRSAEDGGDLYGATMMQTGEANLAWLVAGDPDGARRLANQASHGYSPKAVVVQAYLDSFAQVRIDLYEGKHAEAWTRVGERWSAFQKAQLHNVQLLRIVMTNVRAAAALSSAQGSRERLGQAARDARSLRKEGASWALGLAALVEAGVSAAQGDTEGAATRYARAAIACEQADMALHAACARWRQGELLGGDQGHALRLRAGAFFDEQGLKDPPRMLAVLAPAPGGT